MILLAAFWAWLWQCLQVIWIDSTFAGKEFVAKIERQFGWKLEHVDRVEFEKSGISVIDRPSYADRLNTKCEFYGTLMHKLEGQSPKLPSH
jgi:putative transposase